MSRYQKGKTDLDFTEARDSEWQWHQLGHMQVCNSLQTDNNASTPTLSVLQAGCPSCRPTNSVKALKVYDNGRLLVLSFCCHIMKWTEKTVIYPKKTSNQMNTYGSHRWRQATWCVVLSRYRRQQNDSTKSLPLSLSSPHKTTS